MIGYILLGLGILLVIGIIVAILIMMGRKPVITNVQPYPKKMIGTNDGSFWEIQDQYGNVYRSKGNKVDPQYDIGCTNDMYITKMSGTGSIQCESIDGTVTVIGNTDELVPISSEQCTMQAHCNVNEICVDGNCIQITDF